MTKNEEASRDERTIGGWAVALIALALLLRLGWLAYTNYTEEDAFITFRYARELAQGNGFVYNPGERLYGTTTPLLTLLLAGWYEFIPNDIVSGVRLFDLLATAGTLFFTWKALQQVGQTRAGQLLALALLGLSSKLWLMDTQGMETPLVLFWMAASWYTLIKRQIIWTGVLAGLLLWARIDLLTWVGVLLLAEFLFDAKLALRLALVTGLIYLPWLIFATLYFGSPIPYTIVAKWVAYAEFDGVPLTTHLFKVLSYLSIFDPPQTNLSAQTSRAAAVLAGLTLGLALWGSLRTLKQKGMLILPVFIFVEVASLTLSRATFFNRYFVPSLWAVLILAGAGLGAAWEAARGEGLKRLEFSLMILACAFMLGAGALRAWEVRAKQIYRQDAALKAIGLWLNQNTPPDTVVLLEPLGYVGYYSDRFILDEVGLVTPRVTELKREQVDPGLYFTILRPDTLALHCDDALRMQGGLGEQDTGLARQYRLAQTFNPLNYDPLVNNISGPYGLLPRNSCYQIWERLDQ
jgi:hypothetical protein